MLYYCLGVYPSFNPPSSPIDVKWIQGRPVDWCLEFQRMTPRFAKFSYCKQLCTVYRRWSGGLGIHHQNGQSFDSWMCRSLLVDGNWLSLGSSPHLTWQDLMWFYVISSFTVMVLGQAPFTTITPQSCQKYQTFWIRCPWSKWSQPLLSGSIHLLTRP